jgi:hypothetical protein
VPFCKCGCGLGLTSNHLTVADFALTLYLFPLFLSLLALPFIKVFISVQTGDVAVHACLELGSRFIVFVSVALHMTNERLLALGIPAQSL